MTVVFTLNDADRGGRSGRVFARLEAPVAGALLADGAQRRRVRHFVRVQRVRSVVRVLLTQLVLQSSNLL